MNNSIELAEDRIMPAIKHRWPRLFYAMGYHRTTRDERLTFRDKPWLEALYKDNAKRMVIVKCSQVGITEFALCTMFALAEAGKRGMYLLPDDTWRQTFVADRIDGLLDKVPYYKAAVTSGDKQSDSRQFKNIFGTAWKFAGSNAKTAGSQGQDLKKPKAAFEFQSSALLIDEFDEHSQENLIYFWDRLVDEVDPVVILFGNPTISGKGIAAKSDESDQKVYMVPCDCGYEQELKWYKHFVVKTGAGTYELRDENGNPVCEECGSPFGRLNAGRWVAQNPTSKISGYAIGRLFIKKKETDIQDMFEQFKDAQGNQSKLQNFHNNYLGVVYENTDEKLTEPLLAKCAAKGPATIADIKVGDDLSCIAGLDQGKDFHIKVSKMVEGVRHSVFIGTAQTWGEVNGILDAYNVSTAVADAQGGGYAETREFVRNRDGAWMCYYVPKDRVAKLYDQNYQTQVVNTNRTEILDVAVKAFKDGLVVLPQDWLSMLDGQFYKQMLMPTRVIDAGGRPVWTKGNDHLFHAHAYETLALLISGMHNSVQEQRSWYRH